MQQLPKLEAKSLSSQPAQDIYKLERNHRLKFRLRRISAPQANDEKALAVAPAQRSLLRVEGNDLQRMREACQIQFRQISSLIGRPFPNTTLFSQMEQIKLRAIHSENAAETSAGSNPPPPSPQPTNLHQFQHEALPLPTYHSEALGPVLPEVDELDGKHNYRSLHNRAMFEQEDELQQFLISDMPHNRYNDLSDFL